MISTDQSENSELNSQELHEIVLDLSKKINDIHRLYFSEEQLKKCKNQKQKFLAEILTSPARHSKNT
jgi:septal ring factor EnvC (AmiA/AmiB activator)